MQTALPPSPFYENNTFTHQTVTDQTMPIGRTRSAHWRDWIHEQTLTGSRRCARCLGGLSCETSLVFFLHSPHSNNHLYLREITYSAVLVDIFRHEQVWLAEREGGKERERTSVFALKLQAKFLQDLESLKKSGAEWVGTTWEVCPHLLLPPSTFQSGRCSRRYSTPLLKPPSFGVVRPGLRKTKTSGLQLVGGKTPEIPLIYTQQKKKSPNSSWTELLSPLAGSVT